MSSDNEGLGCGCILSAIMLVIGILVGCHGLGTIISSITTIVGHQFP